MEQRNASAAVIGAGDFIGAAIAKKFAAEGIQCIRRPPAWRQAGAAGRRGRGGRRAHRRPFARCPQRARDRGFPAGRRYDGAAGSVHLQYRSERQFSADRDHRTGVPQSLGDGVLCRFPGRARGGASDGAAGPRQYLLYWSHCEPARGRRLRRLCQRQIQACVPWRRARRASSVRRTSTLRIW